MGENSNSNVDDAANTFAIKVYSSGGDRDHDRHYDKEVRFLRLVQGHPNVVVLCAYLKSSLAIVMPLYDSDLFTFVHASDDISEASAARIMRELLSAVHYIHGQDVVHRDIKPENVAMHGPGNQAILLDFDIACATSDAIAMKEVCGTPGYMAPEVVRGATYDTKADLFSIGCVMYFLFGKRCPFHGRSLSKKAVFRRTVLRECSFDACFDALGFACKHLILLLLAKNTAQRLCAQDALQHYWFAAEEALSSGNDPAPPSELDDDSHGNLSEQLPRDGSAPDGSEETVVASTVMGSIRLGTSSDPPVQANDLMPARPVVADPVGFLVRPPDALRLEVPRPTPSHFAQRTTLHIL
eukprot:TRINITY_DN39675_c0_g1_i1.p1 TRINITY_DN39675_c0_g1~~TRINITY_DN39675_c0_g1_i1.p1  ORF type:complete len:407 (-),score=40.28 TRINITY_DN39675_c0_g1_i1:461-1522(-)